MNFRTGKGYFRVNPSCHPGGSRCKDAFPINSLRAGDSMNPGCLWGMFQCSNDFSAERKGRGVAVEMDVINSLEMRNVSLFTTGAKFGVFDLGRGDIGATQPERDKYPAFELYYRRAGGDVETLLQQPMGHIHDATPFGGRAPIIIDPSPPGGWPQNGVV